MFEINEGLQVMPWSFWVTVAFIFGAIIGSFLNVYIYRFHTGKSLNGSSHCLSCAKQLRWYELIPIVSYLSLRGRCSSCGSYVPVRYAVVEALTASLFVCSLYVATSPLMFFWLTTLCAVLVVIVVYDYYHFIIPDELTVAISVLVGIWLVWEWWQGVLSAELLFVTVGASLLGSAFFYALWFISRGAWLGFGDVKLAFPLGLWVGPMAVFSFVVVSFWIGAAISICVLLWQKYERGKRRLHLSQETLTMKSAVPFAPFMIAGAALVYFTHFDALSLFSFV